MSTTINRSINAFQLVTIAFIVLKLCKIIAWSWWWVLAPLWLPATLIIMYIIIGAVVKTIKDTRNLKN